MMIRVSELEEQGLTVTDPRALEPAFGDPSWGLDALSLQISADGADVLVQGRLAATVPQTCGRCLESFPARVDANLDVDFYVDDLLDLKRVVETETTLVLPMKPLCREDCRGLCPACGGNRNLVACACAGRAPDPRLTALRDLATRLRH